VITGRQVHIVVLVLEQRLVDESIQVLEDRVCLPKNRDKIVCRLELLSVLFSLAQDSLEHTRRK
jgi:hypothetical protein